MSVKYTRYHITNWKKNELQSLPDSQRVFSYSQPDKWVESMKLIMNSVKKETQPIILMLTIKITQSTDFDFILKALNYIKRKGQVTIWLIIIGHNTDTCEKGMTKVINGLYDIANIEFHMLYWKGKLPTLAINNITSHFELKRSLRISSLDLFKQDNKGFEIETNMSGKIYIPWGF